jgi:hypothetical protein
MDQIMKSFQNMANSDNLLGNATTPTKPTSDVDNLNGKQRPMTNDEVLSAHQKKVFDQFLTLTNDEQRYDFYHNQLRSEISSLITLREYITTYMVNCLFELCNLTKYKKAVKKFDLIRFTNLFTNLKEPFDFTTNVIIEKFKPPSETTDVNESLGI